MRKNVALVMIMSLMWTTFLQAQDPGFERSVLTLTGASSVEELDEETFDRFCSLRSRPLRINAVGEKALLASGLFSRYQAASIMDYRKRSGQIMSVMELMLLDGFDGRTAEAAAYFLSFEPFQDTSGGRSGAETLARTAVKEQDDSYDWNYAAKLRVGNDERWSLGVTSRKSYGVGSLLPEDVSFSAFFSGRGGGWSVIAGDFNTRFGQGLLLWSGFSMSGAQSAAAFSKHPSGLSPAWTLSPSAVHRGVAAEAVFGRVVTSAFLSKERMFGANVTWLARSGQTGVSALSSGKTSIDWRWSHGRLDSFGEAAVDIPHDAAAWVAGCTFNPAYQFRISALVRSYATAYDGQGAGAFRSSTKSSDENGAAVALDYRNVVVTADAAFHPSKGTSMHKAVIKYSPQISERFGLAFRLTSRFRPEDACRWRNELRVESEVGGEEGLYLKCCADLCRCRDIAWLSYLEAGFITQRDSWSFSAFARLTAFRINNWDDRIYIYERDVQGAFSVPAYYGRGWSASAVASYKWKGKGTLNFRVSKKPGRAELKIQLIRNLQFHTRPDVG